MLLRLGRDVALYELYQMAHILMLLWQLITVYYIFETLILHIFLINSHNYLIFRDAPGCSGAFHDPGFIDGRSDTLVQKYLQQT